MHPYLVCVSADLLQQEGVKTGPKVQKMEEDQVVDLAHTEYQNSPLVAAKSCVTSGAPRLHTFAASVHVCE